MRFSNRSVRTVPGFTAFTCTPSRIPTSASALVTDSTAAFTLPPIVNSAPGVFPPTPAMLTMAPPLCRNSGQASRASRTAPCSFSA